MPDGLTRIATLLLVALAFGLTFTIQALGGGSSDAKPAAKSGIEAFAINPARGADVSLTAARAVPALRNPRQPRKRRVRTRKPARTKPAAVRKVVVPAPTADPVPLRDTVAEPTPTAAPRYVPTPAPRYVAPAPRPRPRPKPAPTSAPAPSGDFDTTGER